MIPLRPLGVGEILDGAVTTIRRNPRVMLGLSAAVAIISQLVAIPFVWMLVDEAATLEELEQQRAVTEEELLNFFGTAIGGLAIVMLVTWIATVFLTGMLTVVVGRAVLGENLSLADTWGHTKPRLLRLFGLTILYTLIWSGPGLVVILAAVAMVATDAPAAAVGMLALGLIAAVLIGIWLLVLFALATPALMLETTSRADGDPVPIGIIAALRRSSRLVMRSWWRVFGILLLVMIIVFIVSQVVSIPFSLPATLGDGDMFTMAGMSFGALVVNTLGSIVSATITAPFSAGATALLYVDQRIRREALDIELARAADVELPHRSDDGQHGNTLGPR
ncbi:hypothetical protein EF847_04395 [Actinobacteria bacterium YIM 96077]|uniref:DUF7847 domain-containing protein n=1 Tax=Phytoactinopolyspora halophila TaxID=1981511 RepID=A0A329R241_9ACTN|nr:hypothetical protein EF847_04395 [Actinobacteria bacterium YIM 96077]RAW18705.1 hypothetical protein DPM12_01115 [Phytoactinopolyspora halophila]